MFKALLVGVALSTTSLAIINDHKPQPVGRQANKAIREYLLAASVTVEMEDGGGSGVFLKDKAGDLWCLTAAHVTRDLKMAKLGQYRYDKNGKERIFWVWGTVEVSDRDEDISLIKCGRFEATVAKIYKDAEPPEPETLIVHCGSFGSDGVVCHHSITHGSITSVGVPYPPFAYKDQIDITGWYGSSGGGVFLEDGRYVGMLTHGIPRSSRIIFMTPIRRIIEWAGKNGHADLFN